MTMFGLAELPQSVVRLVQAAALVDRRQATRSHCCRGLLGATQQDQRRLSEDGSVVMNLYVYLREDEQFAWDIVVLSWEEPPNERVVSRSTKTNCNRDEDANARQDDCSREAQVPSVETKFVILYDDLIASCRSCLQWMISQHKDNGRQTGVKAVSRTSTAASRR